MSSPNEINLEIKKQTDSLKKFTLEQPDKILKDRKSFLSLVSIGKTIFDHGVDVDFGIFAQKRFDKVISNYLSEILKIRSSINFQTQIDWDIAETVIDRNEILEQTFTYVLKITNLILVHSVEFCSYFVENNGLRLCLESFNDQNFVKKITNAKSNDGSLIRLSDILSMIITNLAQRTCDDQKHVWKSLNAAQILFNIPEVNSNHTFAYLLDDKEIETLFKQNKMKPILDEFFGILIKASVNFKEDNLYRISKEINFKGKSIKCEYHHERGVDDVLTGMVGVLLCLYKFSVNDSIKLAIYFNENVKDCLKTFLEKGNFY